MSPIAAGLRGICPRCGQGRLFAGLLALAPACSVCGLDFKPEESGDGPAAFIILILGALLAPLIFWVEFAWVPPFWAHLLIWPPLVIGGSILLLRPMKGVLAALHIHHDAGEGR